VTVPKTVFNPFNANINAASPEVSFAQRTGSTYLTPPIISSEYDILQDKSGKVFDLNAA
jgi:hypothetical protein